MAIDQYYATSCTKASSTISRATGAEGERFVGYALRAASVRGKQASRANSEIVTRYVKYHLPNDTIPDFEQRNPVGDKRLILTPKNAIRRLIYDVQQNGNQVFGVVFYRETDASKSQRPGSYFAHMLSSNEQAVSPIDILQSWERPFWVNQDSISLQQDLPKLNSFDQVLGKPPPAGCEISDEAFLDFLTAPRQNLATAEQWPTQFLPAIFPARWRAMAPLRRQEIFERLVRNYANPKRKTIYLVAEPAVAALMFYGLARLMPPGEMRRKMTFSTYEEMRVDRGEATAPSTNSRFQLIATVFNNPDTELRKDVYSRFNSQNTFSGRPFVDIKSSNRYVSKVLPMLIDDGWSAVDQLHDELALGEPKSFADLDELLDAREHAAKVLADGIWEDRQRATPKQQEFVRETVVKHFSGMVDDGELKRILANPITLKQAIGFIKSSPNEDRCDYTMSCWLEHWPKDRFDDVFGNEYGFSDLDRQKAVRAYISSGSDLPDGHEFLWKNVKIVKSTQDAILTKILAELRFPAVKKLTEKYGKKDFPKSKTGAVEYALALAFASTESDDKVDLARLTVKNLSYEAFVDFVSRTFDQDRKQPRTLLKPKLFDDIAERTNMMANRIIPDPVKTSRFLEFLIKQRFCLKRENRDCVVTIRNIIAACAVSDEPQGTPVVGTAMNRISDWMGKETQADTERKSRDELGQRLTKISRNSPLSNRLNVHFAGEQFSRPVEDQKVWRQVGEYIRDVLMQFGQQERIEIEYFPEGFSLIHSGNRDWRCTPLPRSKPSAVKEKAKKGLQKKQGPDKVVVFLRSITAIAIFFCGFLLALIVGNDSSGDKTADNNLEPGAVVDQTGKATHPKKINNGTSGIGAGLATDYPSYFLDNVLGERAVSPSGLGGGVYSFELGDDFPVDQVNRVSLFSSDGMHGADSEKDRSGKFSLKFGKRVSIEISLIPETNTLELEVPSTNATNKLEISQILNGIIRIELATGKKMYLSPISPTDRKLKIRKEDTSEPSSKSHNKSKQSSSPMVEIEDPVSNQLDDSNGDEQRSDENSDPKKQQSVATFESERFFVGNKGNIQWFIFGARISFPDRSFIIASTETPEIEKYNQETENHLDLKITQSSSSQYSFIGASLRKERDDRDYWRVVRVELKSNENQTRNQNAEVYLRLWTRRTLQLPNSKESANQTPEIVWVCESKF